jgi:hypothetical protein
VRRRPRTPVSVPTDTPTLSPFPTLPLAHRLGGNTIGAEGATALAAILKETQITNLRCAAAPECLLLCQCPLTRKQTLCGSPSCTTLTYPAPVCHSVGHNNITGDAANHLATVVLEHATMTDFCGIPLASLRENSITELDLEGKYIGVLGAIVLSKLLPSAAALKSLKCACHPNMFAFLSMPADTFAITSISELISFLPPFPSLPPCVLQPFHVLIRAMLPLTVRRVDRGHVLLCRTGGSPLAPVYLPTSPPCASLPPVAAWGTTTSTKRPNRPSETPRAAASASNSSTQPPTACGAPAPDSTRDSPAPPT